MKKVCILSMQKVDNFGSLLQAYSLKKIIESLDNSVEFIDIKKMNEDNKLLNEKVTFSEEKNLLLTKLSKIDKYFFNRILMKNSNKKQNEVFEKFRNKELNISDSSNTKEFDTCVIGSDEVFNCTTNSSWGFTSQLFGNVNNASKVITYAASCGATKFSFLNSEVINRIRNSFEKISAFSVRDENTREFVSKMTDNHISINLDPVLVGDFENEIKENNKIKLPKKYCVVYSYYNRIKSKKEIREIKKICKEKNMEIVSVGAPQFWIKKHLILNPFEALSVFEKAEFVVTDTFHGTIFASKYSKKFVTIVRESNKNKLTDLINRLEQQNHLCNDIKDISTIYNIINDKEKIKNICTAEKTRTIEYLSRNI